MRRTHVRRHLSHRHSGTVPVSEHSRISRKKLNYFIEDEKKAVEEYSKAGLPNLAREEAGHLAFLKNLGRMKYQRQPVDYEMRMGGPGSR